MMYRHAPPHGSGCGRMTDGIGPVNPRTGTDGVRAAAHDGARTALLAVFLLVRRSACEPPLGSVCWRQAKSEAISVTEGNGTRASNTGGLPVCLNLPGRLLPLQIIVVCQGDCVRPSDCLDHIAVGAEIGVRCLGTPGAL
jgi:hypothetical protein